MSEKTYYERNRDVILNRAKDYFENVRIIKRKSKKKNIENYLKKKKI